MFTPRNNKCCWKGGGGVEHWEDGCCCCRRCGEEYSLKNFCLKYNFLLTQGFDLEILKIRILYQKFENIEFWVLPKIGKKILLVS